MFVRANERSKATGTQKTEGRTSKEGVIKEGVIEEGIERRKETGAASRFP